jgi:CRISPR-associated protein Csx10
MHSLTYRIITQSPIIISAISGDQNIVRTKQYIPGNTVLGVLAKRIIKKKSLGEKAHQDEDFYAWFLRGKLKIGNAYIVSSDVYKEYLNFPSPLSIGKEKYGSIVYDALFTETDETQYIGDFCCLTDDSLQIQSVKTQIGFHYGRNVRNSGDFQKDIFTCESIASEQTFKGEILGDSGDLERLLQYTGKQWTAYIGRSKNAQYGKVNFQFVNDKPQKRTFDISADINKQISMTLLSDLILYNDFGYPTIDVDILEKELRNRLGDVRIKKAFVKKSEVENFISVWRLKKPSESCFKAGSVFLLEIDKEELSALQALQESGIGERRHEGFGRVAFGWQNHSELYLLKNSNKPEEPKCSPPQTVREIVQFVIQDMLLESIKLEAVNQQNDFVCLPSNSLISRLYAMAEKSQGDRIVFLQEINKLRVIATNQLKRCASRDFNLLEFLSAFIIDESTVEKIIQDGFDDNKIKMIKNKAIEKEFILIEELEQYIGLGKEDKFTESEKKLLLGSVQLLYEPVEIFFRQDKAKDIYNLNKEIGCELNLDFELKKKLSYAYYTTFFSIMRKRKIAEEKRNA